MSNKEPFDNMTKSCKNKDNSVKNDKKKKSILPSIFSKKEKNGNISNEDVFPEGDVVLDLERRYMARKSFLEASAVIRKSFSDRHSRIEGLNLSTIDRVKRPLFEVQEFRVFVGTWNVGGKTPNCDLNLEDFLQVEGSADIYVLGFQEIVPLNAGNVLVIEDSEPAAKWLALICQALNKPRDSQSRDEQMESSSGSSKHSKDSKSSNFQKTSMKALTKRFGVDSAFVKTCNCTSVPSNARRRAKEMREFLEGVDSDSSSQKCSSSYEITNCKSNYRLIANKQMVGLFLSVWVRKDLVQHIGHLRMSSVGRGIMGCLGNKGCTAVSMTINKTSFCFVCSHLASGEKEGDELRRNSDVAEILKSTQFPRICKFPGCFIPEKIIDHDRIIWLGDLNYRVALSYEETRALLEENDWDAILQKDQLILEREAGRVFQGWKEGKIYFAPTYKYSQNSDSYAGETAKSKKNRRTPAWCDRILWHGSGIEQLQYTRGESRFSDHRPVCAVFVAQVDMANSNFRKGYSTILGSRIPLEDIMPQRHSFYEY